MLKISICIFVAVLAVLVIGLPTPEENGDDVAIVSPSPLEDEDGQRPGYCKVGDVYIKEGEKGAGPIGKCMKITCVSATPGAKKVSGKGCPSSVPPPGCHETAYDQTKRFPACCPQTVCDDKQSQEE